MTVPDRFVGAWRRTELRVDGELVAPDGDADVLWLQAPHWYADLRIPTIDGGGPVEAFAGPARWDAPRFTWEHHLDWIATYPSDVGTFDAVGDDLIERGTFLLGEREVPYEERWVRAATERTYLVAMVESPTGAGVLVEVGPHRLLLVDGRSPAGGEFAVRRDERGPQGWVRVFERGPVPVVDGAVPDPDAVAVGDSIAVGDWALAITELGDRGPAPAAHPT